MENNLGFIKSSKVLLLLFGVFGILIIASLSISITNINSISEESESTDAETKKLDGRVEILEKSLADLEDGGDSEDINICQSEKCYEVAHHLSQYIDDDTDPCYDFYQFTCGKWQDINALDPNAFGSGTFATLSNEIGDFIKAILENDNENDAQGESLTTAKNYFTSCQDDKKLDTNGKTFYKELFGPGGAMGGYPMLNPTWEEAVFSLESAISRVLFSNQNNPLISAYVDTDAKNVKKNVIYVDQGSLGLLPVNYLEPGTNPNALKEYETLIKETANELKKLLKVNMNVNEADIKDIIQFETNLAKIMIPASERRDPTKLYNQREIKDLAEKYPNFDWIKFIKELLSLGGAVVDEKKEKIIDVVPKYFEELSKLLLTSSPRILSNYIHWRTLFQSLWNGPKEFQDLYIQFTTNAFNAKSDRSDSVESPRTGYCSRLVSAPFQGMGGMGFAVAYEYIKKAFDNNSKKEVNELVDNLRVAFKELVDESTWMSEETKKKAQGKADGIIQSLGYPDWLMEDGKVEEYYKDLKGIAKDNFLNNLKTVYEFESKKSISKIREVPNREEWPLHPAVVNAVYSPTANSITFPAGILQYPFFKAGIPSYLNYGSIGVVIGHEITHGFDDQGKQYAGDGTLQNWWSNADNIEFGKKAQCIIDQYSSFVVEEIGMNVNGDLTQGENIADNGGLRESLRAFRKSLQTKKTAAQRLPGKLSKFTPEQLFFVAYSQTWCEIESPATLASQVLSDPHSPGRFRSIGAVSNSDDFAKAFNCPVSSPMNRGDDRCVVW